MSSGYLGSIADVLLNALVAGLAPATTGRPAPSTQYVSHGPPSRLGYCCDDGYAVVYLDPDDGVTHNSDLDRFDQDCLIIPRACWILEWGRCVPSLTEDGWPDSADLDTSATDLLEDLWCVLTELYDRRVAGSLVGESCGDTNIGQAVPLEPQGGCAGWQVHVCVILNDPGPVGS